MKKQTEEDSARMTAAHHGRNSAPNLSKISSPSPKQSKARQLTDEREKSKAEKLILKFKERDARVEKMIAEKRLMIEDRRVHNSKRYFSVS